MTETDAGQLEWSQPFGSGSGRWSADTRVNGVDVEITVNGIHPGPHCPCAPGECEYPGVPYVTVYALSWVPVTEPAASGRHYLTSPEQSVHVAEPLAIPDFLTGMVALKLAIMAAGSERTALRDLARHAARITAAPPPVTEHGLQMSGGGFHVRNGSPVMEKIYPVAEWIEGERACGHHVFRRKVIVVEDWTEVERL